MGLKSKIRHAAERTQGKHKETSGKSTTDESLETEGKADETKTDLKKAGSHVKVAFKH